MIQLVVLLLGVLPRTHVVEIRGMAFQPAVLNVAVGDTVVWINRDIVPHTATSAGQAKWDTGPLLDGAAGRYIPSRAGILKYICTFHPTMRATLVIKEHS